MDYFNILDLKREPFSNSPDPGLFFHSRQHLECLQKLELSLLLRRGLNVVIGDIGTGKTTMCRQVIRRFAARPEVETGLILDPHFLYAGEFLSAVAKLLTGRKPPAGTPDWQIKEYIKQHLFHKGVEQNKTIILIIDEGQKIPAFSLEILREFLNYETNEHKLLQIVIFAQREFEKTIRKFPNFADRISLYHLLRPLSFSETRRMIAYRLKKSGHSPHKNDLFTYAALRAIYRISGGYPRQIINLCHQSLLAMIIRNRSRVDYFLVRTCGRRIFPSEVRRGRLLWGTLVAGTAAATVIFLAAMSPGRLPTVKFMGISQFISEFSHKFAGKTTWPVSGKEQMAQARMAPGGFDRSERHATDVGLTPDAGAAGTEMDIRTEETDSIVAAPGTVSGHGPPASLSETGYGKILGHISLQRTETVSRIIGQVYGEFDSSRIQAFIAANPGIADPDQVEAGRIIALPAIPIEFKPGEKHLCWIQLAETDTLAEAFNILRSQPGNRSDLRLIPYWNSSSGMKFSVILNTIFNAEQAARSRLKSLPAILVADSQIVTGWDRKATYFADPYVDRAGQLWD